MKKVAVIRGKFLTKYDMEPFERLSRKYQITAFGSKNSMAEEFTFPVVKLWSPVDSPDFPYKMPILNRLFVDAQYLMGLEEQLKGFDIAHSAETYFGYTQQALNAKRTGYIKKVVVSVLENIPFNNEGIWGRKRFKNRAITQVDHFIALSELARSALISEGVSERKISKIGFAINTKKFYPDKRNRKDRINILFAGRIEEYKGILDVLEVFNSLLKDSTNIKLTIIGKGSKEKELVAKIKHLGINKFVAHKVVSYDKIAEEYRKADIFFAPSKRDRYWVEQFGMVFLEAMASGLPIVTTRSGAIPEVVGETALLTNEGDIKTMKKLVHRLILNEKLRKKLSKKARERVIELFDVDVISKKIDQVYQTLL